MNGISNNNNNIFDTYSRLFQQLQECLTMFQQQASHLHIFILRVSMDISTCPSDLVFICKNKIIKIIRTITNIVIYYTVLTLT